MQAALYRNFGPASDVIEIATIDTPPPATGEVTVDLAYSGVNPSDVKARAGLRPGVTKPAFPRIIPHSDGAGVISAVGDGVDPGRIGERVWIWNGQWQRAFGTCATQITVPTEQAVPLPEKVDFETGAVLGIPGLTAAHGVFGSGDVAGQTLLIPGGAGTVGLLAVQLAHGGGARVIATARGAAAMTRVADAGADAVLDYAAPDLAQQVLAANNGAPVDRIVEVEFGQNAAVSAEVIAANGTILAYGSAKDMTPRIPFGPLMFKAVTLEMALIYILPPEKRAACIGRLHDALLAGTLRPPIAEILPLSQTARAHELVEAGGRSGAVLVAPR